MPIAAAVGLLVHAGMAALMSAALQRMWLRNRKLALSMVLLIFVAFEGALVALAIGKM
jgi:MFS superfamily sulfate permease-like transporter